jgi:hypothetical protein
MSMIGIILPLLEPYSDIAREEKATIDKKKYV